MNNDTAAPPDDNVAAAMPASPSDTGTSPVLRLGLALALVVTAQFVLQLDFSIVNIALPTIKAQMHVSSADLQWIVTGYALTFGSLLLFGGRVGDRVGHRRVMLAGLVVFGVASLVAGLAPTSLALIVSRFAQGASAAFVAPQALALITDLFAEGPARTRALGIFQGATAAGASAGIVLGGICTEFIGWRAVFLVNPPIIVLLVLAIRRVIPARTRHTGARLDFAGALLATASIAALIFGLSQGQQRGFSDPAALAALGLAVLLGVAFVVVQRRSAAPMVPLPVLADPARRAALVAMLLFGAVLVAYIYFTSLYMQEVLRFSPLRAGLAFVPATGTVMLTATQITRRVLPRFGVRKVLLTGLIVGGLGQVWLHTISNTGSYQVNILGGIMITSFGMGLAFPTASVAVTSGVGPSERGLAGGLFVTAQQVGQAIGLAALATIAAAQTNAHGGSLVTGYRASFAVAIGICVAAVLIVAIQMRTRTTRKTNP
ncbi:MFS transporter [Catenulispora pinisilvae]|uniref:MFS transporter n=1 Tax=Catenulispora pinisilvae TaxID=2705253 RepID=UPI00189204D2|nr:MFS transporter [Catenulispora pinisilvae]